LAVITAGGLSGVTNWLVAVPPDVLKSRYQAAEPGKYTSIRQVATELLQTEGPGAFFKGLAPALTRAFPANAACFLGSEFGARRQAFAGGLTCAHGSPQVEASRKMMDKFF
jgi:solute carrier family 25 carnitine/acylcarnitine transporter 20/29